LTWTNCQIRAALNEFGSRRFRSPGHLDDLLDALDRPHDRGRAARQAVRRAGARLADLRGAIRFDLATFFTYTDALLVFVAAGILGSTDLTEAAIKEMAEAVDALGEPVSRVAEVVAR
jgi:hypothetical protein